MSDYQIEVVFSFLRNAENEIASISRVSDPARKGACSAKECCRAAPLPSRWTPKGPPAF